MSTDQQLADRLRGFLARQPDLPSTVEIAGYARMPGGYSRSMARFTVRAEGRSHEYVIRSDPPAGTTMLVTDRSREWSFVKPLSDDGSVPMPVARWCDPTGEDLGSPAIVFDFVGGDNLLARWRSGDAAEHQGFADRLCELAVQVHRSDLSKLPPGPANWDEYLADRIAQWRVAAEQSAEAAPFVHFIAAWLEANRPGPAPLTLVHGDLQAPNVIVQADGSFVLVDWELARIGDPREDLGWSRMAAASQGCDLIGDHLDSFCERYRVLTGLDEETVNADSIDYFTILSSVDVYAMLLRQSAGMTRGETTSMNIAYITAAQPFMHGVWMETIRRLRTARSSLEHAR